MENVPYNKTIVRLACVPYQSVICVYDLNFKKLDNKITIFESLKLFPLFINIGTCLGYFEIRDVCLIFLRETWIFVKGYCIYFGIQGYSSKFSFGYFLI